MQKVRKEVKDGLFLFLGNWMKGKIRRLLLKTMVIFALYGTFKSQHKPNYFFNWLPEKLEISLKKKKQYFFILVLIIHTLSLFVTDTRFVATGWPSSQ